MEGGRTGMLQSDMSPNEGLIGLYTPLQKESGQKLVFVYGFKIPNCIEEESHVIFWAGLACTQKEIAKKHSVVLYCICCIGCVGLLGWTVLLVLYLYCRHTIQKKNQEKARKSNG
jgi:hypothetical protein